MNDLQIFNSTEFGEIRTVTIDDEPWFVAKDISDKLGYAQTSNMMKRIDSEDSKSSILDGMNMKSLLINESGLYSAILGSKLESAKRFKHWVTSDVLPTIRKHGMYAQQELLDNPDLLIAVATQLKEERQKNLLLEQKIEADRPKTIFADAVSASDSSMLVRDVAKIIKQNGQPLGEKRFYKWLRDNGFICKGDTSPTQKAMEMGLFEIVVRTVERGNGLPIETKTTRITGKGQQYFINKFLGQGKE